MDSFRPGATSYCPFQNKAELGETGAAPAWTTEDLALLRPSELRLARPADTAGRTEASDGDTEVRSPGAGHLSVEEEKKGRRRS